MLAHRSNIIVTGAAGFIASCLIEALNQRYPEHEIIAIDDFTLESKQHNHQSKLIKLRLDRAAFPEHTSIDPEKVCVVFHLGARTDTTEKDWDIFEKLNLSYSKKVWQWCSRYNIPLIYASSAATYGDGKLGYEDRHEIVKELLPLNPYGVSKNDFDKWVLANNTHPPHWYGLKFFNVYGPNEYHKGRMASVVYHAFNQIRTTGKMQLFMSHRADIPHGHQSRDFIYVKDVVNMCIYLFEQLPTSGLYNIGTGKARSFLDLVRAVFDALELEADINFIPTPLDIRDTYQYYTEANMNKLQKAGYEMANLYSLEEGIAEYVSHYLSQDNKIY